MFVFRMALSCPVEFSFSRMFLRYDNASCFIHRVFQSNLFLISSITSGPSRIYVFTVVFSLLAGRLLLARVARFLTKPKTHVRNDEP